MPNIVHFTTVHPRNDTRIRIKEAATLARHWPGDVTLFVQDGKGDEDDAEDGVRIRDTGAPEKGRLRRMTFGTWRMFRAVWKAKPDIAHFHDPELLPWALLLRLVGIRIVYDVHEDVPAALQSKTYINPRLRVMAGAVISTVEGTVARFCAAVIPATPAIGQNFRSIDVTLVQNFPLVNELLVEVDEKDALRRPHFAYIGGLSYIRGSVEMLHALALVKHTEIRLEIAGGFLPKLETELKSMPGWGKTEFHGWASRPQVAEILGRCCAGLVVFHPEPNHIRAQPNKMFEYMAAGIPVIASDFPLWREIVKGAGCGLLVDPMNPQEIAEAMAWMVDHPDEARQMGQRGRMAILAQYNWESESGKLLNLYRNLLA